MFTKLQGYKQPPKIINVAVFGKYQIFQDRLKNSTQIKRYYVKTFDVGHDAKYYRASQGVTSPMKKQFFSMISFLNNLKFYNEELYELS